MLPLVSIIIPTYNRADLIGNTLDSVLNQNYSLWECIIVDDGSQDNTKLIVDSYCRKDSRFKYYHRPANKNKGASACRNYGLEISQGELIQFLDDDDLLHKNKLTEQIKFYTGNNELLTCKWGGFEEISDLSKRFKYKYHCYRNFNKGKNLLNSFGKYNEFFPLHVYLTPRKLIDKAGIWNEELTNNDDAEFFSRVILNASKISFLHEAIVYYRYSGTDKLSELNNPAKVESAIKSWKLIEEAILKNNKSNGLWYVNRTKNNLYNRLIENSEVIQEQKRFFESRNGYDTFYYKIYKKIEILLKL